MRAGGSAGRHGGAAHRAVFQHDVDLDGRIAAAVQNLAADDVDDGGHVGKSPKDRSKCRARLSRSRAKFNPESRFIGLMRPIHEIGQAVTNCQMLREESREKNCAKSCDARGETEGVSPCPRFPGIVSLFLIVAAFMTSCNPQPTQGDTKPIAPFFSK